MPFGKITHLIREDHPLLALHKVWEKIITLANVDLFAWYLRKKA